MATPESKPTKAEPKPPFLVLAYERFEQAIVLLLIVLLAVIVVVAAIDLTVKVVQDLIVHSTALPLDENQFRSIFGMVLTVIIALEFKRSLLVSAERRRSIVQARVVVLIGLLAMVRKVIVDMGETAALDLFGIGAVVLALGIVYWLIRDQDRKQGSDDPD